MLHKWFILVVLIINHCMINTRLQMIKKEKGPWSKSIACSCLLINGCKPPLEKIHDIVKCTISWGIDVLYLIVLLVCGNWIFSTHFTINHACMPFNINLDVSRTLIKYHSCTCLLNPYWINQTIHVLKTLFSYWHQDVLPYLEKTVSTFRYYLWWFCFIDVS